MQQQQILQSQMQLPQMHQMQHMPWALVVARAGPFVRVCTRGWEKSLPEEVRH